MRFRRWFNCVALLVLVPAHNPSALKAQDGASYNPDAKNYRPPALSLAGSADTPERSAALVPAYRGNIDGSLSALQGLAERGDVVSALLLGSLYRQKGKLPIIVDPARAFLFYKIASTAGSGEGSEHIAEMIEERQISAPPEGGASYWRNLAVKQGWNEQRIAVYCFDWTRGSEPLHCETYPTPGGNMPPEAQQKCPTESEMTTLVNAGITGRIQLNGGGFRLDHGPEARAILLLDHAVPREADLMEPDATSVLYIQTPQDRWRMIPASAQLLNRFIILKPGEAGMGRTSLGVQAVDGSQSGGACSKFTSIELGAAAPQPTSGRPPKINISAGVALGLLAHKVDPLYPPEAADAGVSGTVVLLVTISKAGKVEDLRVISGPPILHPAALEAVKQWTYRPYVLDDEPVEFETTVNVTFHPR